MGSAKFKQQIMGWSLTDASWKRRLLTQIKKKDVRAVGVELKYEKNAVGSNFPSLG